MKKLGLLALSFSIIALFFACQNSPKTTTKTSDDHLAEFRAAVARVNPDLASPGEIAILIELTGAEFVPSIISDTSKVHTVLGDPDMAAIALGMYTADLAYTSSFKQTAQSAGTLVACQMLANDLGIGETYQTAMMNYYSEVIEGRQDSIELFLEQETGKIRETLNSNDQQRLYTAFVTGFVLENLHLATQIIETYPSDLLPDDAKALVLREMILVVLESKKNISELTTMIEEVLTPEDPGILLVELNELKAILDKVDFNEIAKMEKPADILSNEVLVETTKKVAEILDFMDAV